MPDSIEVAAGALFDDAGRVLIAERQPGKHMAGFWEFPGGKLSAGETPRAALARELAEELGVTVGEARPLIRIVHRYPDREILLHVFSVDAYRGVPGSREGQRLQWVVPASLGEQRLLPADVPIVNALRLPDRYLVTPWHIDVNELTGGIRRAIANGIELIQLRTALSIDELENCADALKAAGAGARLVVNGDPAHVIDLARMLDAGIHVPARFLSNLAGLKNRPWPVGASCHDAAELERAVAAGADFVVLGPVKQTASHPGGTSLGWDAFGQLVQAVNTPVFGIGGLGIGDIGVARVAGGHGIAAIRGLWG